MYNSKKMYVIFRIYSEIRIGYYYLPKNWRAVKNKKINNFTIFDTDDSYNFIESNVEILAKGKSEKYLRRKYPHYFI
jgi:hypothetical protein